MLPCAPGHAKVQRRFDIETRATWNSRSRWDYINSADGTISSLGRRTCYAEHKSSRAAPRRTHPAADGETEDARAQRLAHERQEIEQARASAGPTPPPRVDVEADQRLLGASATVCSIGGHAFAPIVVNNVRLRPGQQRCHSRTRPSVCSATMRWVASTKAGEQSKYGVPVRMLPFCLRSKCEFNAASRPVPPPASLLTGPVDAQHHHVAGGSVVTGVGVNFVDNAMPRTG